MAYITGRTIIVGAGLLVICSAGCTERDAATSGTERSRDMGSASPGDPIRKGDAPAARDMGRYPGDVPGEKQSPPPPAGRSPR